jgi:hypothetical protein
MSEEVLLVIAGALCGITVSIPIAIGLVVVNAMSRADSVLRADRKANEIEQRLAERGTFVRIIGGRIHHDGRIEYLVLPQ